MLTYEQKKGKKKKASTNKAAAKPTKRQRWLAKQPADAEAKRRRRGRGIDVTLSDARMADLDEVSKRLRELLQRLTTQRGKRGSVHWRRPSLPLPLSRFSHFFLSLLFAFSLSLSLSLSCFLSRSLSLSCSLLLSRDLSVSPFFSLARSHLPLKVNRHT